MRNRHVDAAGLGAIIGCVVAEIVAIVSPSRALRADLELIAMNAVIIGAVFLVMSLIWRRRPPT